MLYAFEEEMPDSIQIISTGEAVIINNQYYNIYESNST